MKANYFLTTAIDYTNGAPHLGHAYEKVLADVLARYHRLQGKDVFFLTGVDQHGQKVQQSAEKKGVAPQEFVDGVTAQFRALWEKLDVQYNEWAATTEPRHQTCVRDILQRLWDDIDPATGTSRWIYKDKRGGYYSVRQEQFLTDKERGSDGQFGAEWGQVEFREEENYYFRLEGRKQWLLDLIDARNSAGTPLVVPEFRVAELRNAVERLGGDLCISRPKARLSWGIELPFDADYVTFVWFDALVNYISFAPGYDPAVGATLTEFRRWWPALHIIGKDILVPAHGVYWPIMLHALGFADDEIPTLLVHGWWNISGEKMSKTLGNIVDPGSLADTYGEEALRYYLMRDIRTGRDADFSEERLIQQYNSDLANKLGNLLNRALNMLNRYCGGKLAVRAGSAFYDETLVASGDDVTACTDLAAIRRASQETLVSGVRAKMERYEVDEALEAISVAASVLNETVEKYAPWKLAKDPAQKEKLDALLYHLAESLRLFAILISPVLPRAAQGMFDQLNWKPDLAGKAERFRLDEAGWGGLPDGHAVNMPTPLFPKLENKAPAP